MRSSSIILCLLAELSGAWAGDYLSNLGNPWIDPGNPTCNCSIGDFQTLLENWPFAVQFFTGATSGGTNPAAINTVEQGAVTTNSIPVGFQLNSVTFEFDVHSSQPWSNLNVQVYQQVGGQGIPLGGLRDPMVNPKPTQWPGTTIYVDYLPLTNIMLQPLSEYSLALSVPSTSSGAFGLLFTIFSNFVTTTDWRMGATTTQDPWAVGEFLKVAIDATAIPGTNSATVGLSNVRLVATRVGTNLVLSWPTSAPACQLSALRSPQATAWSPVSTQPIITNSCYTVTLPVIGPGCFFRLQASAPSPQAKAAFHVQPFIIALKAYHHDTGDYPLQLDELRYGSSIFHRSGTRD